MKLEQIWQPDFKYCIYCGKETESETCSDEHENKITAIRNAVEGQKEDDKNRGSGVAWIDKTIRAYNSLMEILNK